MYQIEKEDQKEKSQLSNHEPRLDLNLDKAIAALKQNVSWYQLAGMTHISSLLE